MDARADYPESPQGVSSQHPRSYTPRASCRNNIASFSSYYHPLDRAPKTFRLALPCPHAPNYKQVPKALHVSGVLLYSTGLTGVTSLTVARDSRYGLSTVVMV